MSEATSPNEQVQSAPAAAVVQPNAQADEPARAGRGWVTLLLVLALLLALLGAAAGGWSLWQLRALERQDQQQLALLTAVRAQGEALEQRAQQFDARLRALPDAAELEQRRGLLARLQGDQQLLNQRLETVLGASRQDWRLAEAEHLLRLASLRLSALQDIASAEALVAAADEILRDQNDPAAFAAREQLAASLEALRTTPDPDRTGLFLQLGALRDQASQLHALNPVFEGNGGVLGDLAAEGDGSSWWADWLQTLSQYFRLDFDADQNIRPLLAGQSLVQVRLALSLALEQAQWAALHGHGAVYRQALLQAREVLDGHFSQDNPASRALRARIDELIDRPIEVAVPDLSDSLSALQAYLQRKASARAQLEGAPGAAQAAATEEEARP